MIPSQNRILLLDLYPKRDRHIILPYLYLGAFLDSLDIEYDIYRYIKNDEGLLQSIETGRITHVFINVIMGPVLGLAEQVSRLIKEHFPWVKIWVGGIAVHYVRRLLEACPHIDRVSSAHPCYDPGGFARELYQAGLLKDAPVEPVVFPSILKNRHMHLFLHCHMRGEQQIQSINIASASGCIHSCSFCYLKRTQPWAQPINALVSDLVALQQEYDVRYFEFSDDNFTADRARLDAFCQAVRTSGLDFSYFCLCSVDTLNAQVLDQMCASGLKRLYIGVDGLTPNSIRQLKKGYSVQEARRVIELVRTYPLDLSLAVVLGTPGETRQQVQELYDWVASIQPEFSLASFLTPYPGTSTYRKALRLGFQPPNNLKDWGDVAFLHTPKAVFNPEIGVEEYREWFKRFIALSTMRYRSGIGESVRRL